MLGTHTVSFQISVAHFCFDEHIAQCEIKYEMNSNISAGIKGRDARYSNYRPRASSGGSAGCAIDLDCAQPASHHTINN